jgi:type II secretory pathway component PulJ
LIEMLGSAALFALLAVGIWNAYHLIQAWLATHQ